MYKITKSGIPAGFNHAGSFIVDNDFLSPAVWQLNHYQAHKSPRKVIDPHLTPNKNMTAHYFYNYRLFTLI